MFILCNINNFRTFVNSYSYLDDYVRAVENSATSKGIRSYIEERVSKME